MALVVGVPPTHTTSLLVPVIIAIKRCKRRKFICSHEFPDASEAVRRSLFDGIRLPYDVLVLRISKWISPRTSETSP